MLSLFAATAQGYAFSEVDEAIVEQMPRQLHHALEAGKSPHCAALQISGNELIYDHACC